MEKMDPSQNWHDSWVKHACLHVCACVRTHACVCGKRGARERPRCLRSDSVFAVGHSIFLQQGGEILDSDQILTV